MTPEFHHCHHASYPESIHTNYSVFLPVWDIIWGTYRMPDDQRPERYGVDQPTPDTVSAQLIHPFTRTVRERYPFPPRLRAGFCRVGRVLRRLVRGHTEMGAALASLQAVMMCSALDRAAQHPRLMVGDSDEPVSQGRTAANFATIEAEIDAPRASLLARFLKRIGVDDRIVVFLTLAPMGGFRLFLVELGTVFSASTTMLLIGSLLIPAGLAARIAWMQPRRAAGPDRFHCVGDAPPPGIPAAEPTLADGYLTVIGRH